MFTEIPRTITNLHNCNIPRTGCSSSDNNLCNKYNFCYHICNFESTGTWTQQGHIPSDCRTQPAALQSEEFRKLSELQRLKVAVNSTCQFFLCFCFPQISSYERATDKEQRDLFISIGISYTLSMSHSLLVFHNFLGFSKLFFPDFY